MKTYTGYLLFLLGSLSLEPLVQKGSCNKMEMKSFKSKMKTFETYLAATKARYATRRKGTSELPEIPDYGTPIPIKTSNLRFKQLHETLVSLEDDTRQAQGDDLVSAIEDDSYMRKKINNSIKNVVEAKRLLVTSLGAVKKVSRKPTLRSRTSTADGGK